MFYGHYAGQPCDSLMRLQLWTGGFVGAKFYCPHALADSNQRIWIIEKTLVEFSSTVLYCLHTLIVLTIM